MCIWHCVWSIYLFTYKSDKIMAYEYFYSLQSTWRGLLLFGMRQLSFYSCWCFYWVNLNLSLGLSTDVQHTSVIYYLRGLRVPIEELPYNLYYFCLIKTVFGRLVNEKLIFVQTRQCLQVWLPPGVNRQLSWLHPIPLGLLFFRANFVLFHLVFSVM